MKELYTFVLEHNGGIYTSQVISDSLRHAFSNWLNELVVPDVLELSSAEKNKIEADVDEFGISPLDGLVNIWYVSLSFTDESVSILNIVKTHNLNSRS